MPSTARRLAGSPASPHVAPTQSNLLLPGGECSALRPLVRVTPARGQVMPSTARGLAGSPASLCFAPTNANLMLPGCRRSTLRSSACLARGQAMPTTTRRSAASPVSPHFASTQSNPLLPAGRRLAAHQLALAVPAPGAGMSNAIHSTALGSVTCFSTLRPDAHQTAAA